MDTVHNDVMGTITPEFVSGFRFLPTIIDQAICFKIIRFLKITKNLTLNEKVFHSVSGEGKLLYWNDEEELNNNQHCDLPFEAHADIPMEDNSSINLNYPQEIENKDPTYSYIPGVESADETIIDHKGLSIDSPINDLDNSTEPFNHQHSSISNRPARLKVIGPRYPTLITSNVDPVHILP
ncbi:hypothetical protein O181_002135 [Austropuccinia psidii MF-1]|uniref:Uncharacterized protein n=1 Tax=Austropuccinia psidii MF-1 TaxID=1389203 RepID=A0A9Q3BCG2_9BASI|nr:hypothetical protein [Austropuccinia psidii MF-1]